MYSGHRGHYSYTSNDYVVEPEIHEEKVFQLPHNKRTID